MLQLSHNCRYWLYRPITDMRKSFDSLCGIVKSEMKQDILSGDVFVFVKAHQIKDVVRRSDTISALTAIYFTGFMIFFSKVVLLFNNK